MTFSALLAVSSVLLVVEADPGVPRAEVNAVEAQVATILSQNDYDYRTVGDLQTLPGAASILAEANAKMEAGVRSFVAIELVPARTALDEAIAGYREAGAELWGSAQLARALLFRGLVDLADGGDDAGAHFTAALSIDPTLTLEKGTYSPSVIAAFEQAREVFLQTGYQPRPPEVWGGTARRLGTEGVVLIKLLQENQRIISMSYLEVTPEGSMSTKAREGVKNNTPRGIERATEALLATALGPKRPPKWRKWAYIGGGVVGAFALIAVAGEVNKPRVDTQVFIPTPTPPN